MEQIVLGNRYKLFEEIGSGGMAHVFKARDTLLDRTVAIKILKPDFTDDAQFIERFRVEAKSAASLSDANIVMIYDVGQDDGIYYIIMEYVDGITLKEYITNLGSIPWKEAVTLALQMTQAIETAHVNHIIHRDIKPQNILITKDRKIKITDFGIARAASTSKTTTVGNAMGSVHYFSPEQAKGAFTDEKSDIYSLGITLYEMLTGEPPFDGETPIAIALKHIQEAAEPPHFKNPRIPVSLGAVVLKSIAKDKFERYNSMSEMTADLKQAYNDETGASLIYAGAYVTENSFGAATGGYNGEGYNGADYPAGGYPASGYPAGGYPEGGYPAGGYPAGGYPEGEYPVGGYPADGYPAGGYPASGYPGGYRGDYADEYPEVDGYAADYTEVDYTEEDFTDDRFADVVYDDGIAYEDEDTDGRGGGRKYGKQGKKGLFGGVFGGKKDGVGKLNGSGGRVDRSGRNVRDTRNDRSARNARNTSNDRNDRGVRDSRGKNISGAVGGGNRGGRGGSLSGSGGSARGGNGSGGGRRMGVFAAITLVAAVAAIAFVLWMMDTIFNFMQPMNPIGGDSAANEDFSVENYIGQRYDGVKEELNAEGINVLENRIPNDIIAEGVITAQSVDAGMLLKRNGTDTITFEVSGGAKLFIVPDYMERGAESRAAEAELRANGLNVSVQDEQSENVDIGYVVRTDPPAGEELAAGERITIYRSSGGGAILSAVPQLLLHSYKDALELLEIAGLKPGEINPSSPGSSAVVVRQDPMPNTPVDPGVAVNMWFEESEITTTERTTEATTGEREEGPTPTPPEETPEPTPTPDADATPTPTPGEGEEDPSASPTPTPDGEEDPSATPAQTPDGDGDGDGSDGDGDEEPTAPGSGEGDAATEPQPSETYDMSVSLNLPTDRDYGDTIKVLVEATPSDTGRTSQIRRRNIKKNDFPYNLTFSIPVDGSVVLKVYYDDELMTTKRYPE